LNGATTGRHGAGRRGPLGKGTKQIPDFELADMNGKTWKLKELGGRRCSSIYGHLVWPCQAELPHLEKFYQKTKTAKIFRS